MDRVTLIVVPDAESAVRRYQVSRRLIRYAPWAAVAIAILVLAGSIDWVRLHLDAADVDSLRQQTARQRGELDRLAGGIVSLEEELGRLREFERKVRVMADLPGAVVEAAAPDGQRDGLGGDLEASPGAETRPEAAAEPQSSAPGGQGGPVVVAGSSPPNVSLDRDGETLAEARARVRSLAIRAAGQSISLAELIEGLEGKRHRLASTPSIWPTDGWVTSGYGYRISPFTGRRSFHAGLDIASSFGTSVVAPARGRVAFVGRKGPLGKSLVIDHGFGLRTSYGHVADFHVTRGQEIERGQRIASVGSTGRSTGPHLHYTVEVKGKTVNPHNYILE
jgi:murein DD-endopeptidase MepM/ murein hydrolase activator NlpD